MDGVLWGIDLGGTKTEGVILPSLDQAKPLLRLRIETESHKGYDHIIHQVNKLVDQMKQQSGLTPTAIGFGTPGVLDPVNQTMKNCNSTALNGMPLKKHLEEILGVDVLLANDANCFALAETHWGIVKKKAPNAKMVFGIIMGTGVGGGIVHDGRIWNGFHGIGGEWGHNFLDETGGSCYCGKIGCVETVLSGPGLQKFYSNLSGQELTLKQIVEAYRLGKDSAAVQTMERLFQYFGKAVSVVINLLDPDVIVIGGGVGNIDELYTKGYEWIGKYIFNDRVEVPLLKPMLGDSAGVFGAAALVAN